MLEPAAAFFMYVAIGRPRMVGFPLSSQSAMYSVRPIGKPPTSDGMCPSSSGLEEVESAEGKTVDIVAMGVRFNIRRAMTADSYGVGILRFDSEEGLDQACWVDGGPSRLLAARGRIVGTCILNIWIKDALRMLEKGLLFIKRGRRGVVDESGAHLRRCECNEPRAWKGGPISNRDVLIFT